MIVYVVVTIIILGALTYAGFIVAGHLPQAALVDTEALPEEREARKKKDIIRRRVHAGTAAWWKRVAERITPRLWSVRNAYRKAYARVLRLDYKYRRRRPKRLAPEKAAKKIAGLLTTAHDYAETEQYHEAERALLHVLRLDPRNLEAVGFLGDVYMLDRQYAHAKETFAFLANLREQTGDIAELGQDHVRYALACQELGDTTEALEALEMAVSLEPLNPRYLDILLEACILEGDQIRAQEVLEQLREVNPKNQKLDQLEERLRHLSSAGRAPVL